MHFATATSHFAARTVRSATTPQGASGAGCHPLHVLRTRAEPPPRPERAPHAPHGFRHLPGAKAMTQTPPARARKSLAIQIVRSSGPRPLWHSPLQ